MGTKVGIDERRQMVANVIAAIQESLDRAKKERVGLHCLQQTLDRDHPDLGSKEALYAKGYDSGLLEGFLLARTFVHKAGRVILAEMED